MLPVILRLFPRSTTKRKPVRINVKRKDLTPIVERKDFTPIVALGYPDPDFPLNHFDRKRAEIPEFVHWME